MSVEIVQIIDAISHEKGIDRKVMIEAIEAAVLSAARKRFNPELELSVTFDEATGEAELFLMKDVVRTVSNEELEISLKDAKKVDPDAKRGEKVKIPSQLKNLGRIAALNGKQVIMQRVREAEAEILYNSFKDKINDVISGIVLRQERGDIIMDFGRIEGVLPRKEQVPSEKFRRNDRIRAFVLDIKRGPKGVYALLSRTHPGLISRLFEIEVPEIHEGIIEIKGVAREPSGRSKIAVLSKEKDVDPVGACVGMRGVRVQSIVNELMGEKIDIVEWSEEPSVFVANALSPAKIARVNLSPEGKTMSVIVPDDQLSLAIGKRGQNVRLASNLIKWRIDIKGQNQLRQELELSEEKLQKNKEFLLATLQAEENIQEEDINNLLNYGLQSFKKVIEKGKEGLVEVGFAEEKAAVLFDLSEIKHKEEIEREKELAESAKDLEAAIAKEKKDALLKAEASATEQVDSTKSGEKENVETVENIEEFPLEKLPEIPESVMARLKAAGYQTVAEVSGAEASELIEEGLAPHEAEDLQQKTIKFLELYEKV